MNSCENMTRQCKSKRVHTALRHKLNLYRIFTSLARMRTKRREPVANADFPSNSTEKKKRVNHNIFNSVWKKGNSYQNGCVRFYYNGTPSVAFGILFFYHSPMISCANSLETAMDIQLKSNSQNCIPRKLVSVGLRQICNSLLWMVFICDFIYWEAIINICIYCVSNMQFICVMAIFYMKLHLLHKQKRSTLYINLYFENFSSYYR